MDYRVKSREKCHSSNDTTLLTLYNTRNKTKCISISYTLLLLIFILGTHFSYAQNRAIRNGNWSNANTWDNGVPNTNDQVIINKGVTVNINGNHDAKEVIVHGTLNVTENNTLNKSLTTNWVHVNSGGKFQIGSSSNKFDQGNFTLTLNGTSPNSNQVVPLANQTNMTINKNDGFLMVAGNGQLQFFGEDKLSFTKLSETVTAGSNSIVVENIIDRNHDGNLSASVDGQLNWEVGDQIVIASSSTEYTEEDVRSITAIQNLGSTTRLTLNQSLTHRHYGEIETYGQNVDPVSMFNRGAISIDMRAEVALLSRNIKIQGLASQDTDNSFGDRGRLAKDGNGKASNGIGGHVMVMPTAGPVHVEGIQLHLMGQSGRLGRYPFHWHIARDRNGDVFKNSSITNSNNRAVVVHTTDNVLVEGVVVHDIHGHGFFTEDGVEIGNRFINNIAFGIHRVHSNAFEGNAFIVDDTDKFHDGGERFRTTAAFWIANANNEFTGNISAGSQGSGFWFAQPPSPRGAAKDIPEYAGYSPKGIPLHIFKDNTAHSTVTGFVTVARNGSNHGEFNENENWFGLVDPVFENYTAYQTLVGVYPLSTNVTCIFKNFKAADNKTTNNDSDPTLFDGGLIIGKSRGNPYNYSQKGVIGTVFYHGNTVFKDIHIAGFGNTNDIMFKSTNGNRVRPACEVEGLSFEDDGTYGNIDRAQATNYRNTREVYDRDGSLTTGMGGGPGYTFIGNTDWTVDTSLGDVAPSSAFRWALSQQRFANLQTQHGQETGNVPKIFLTSPHGVRQEFILADLGHHRAQLRIGGEYKMEFPNGYNFSTDILHLTLHQWSFPANNIGVVLRMIGMANVIKPQMYATGTDIPIASSLGQLRSANQDTYFKSGNDLYLKIMNRGPGVHSGYLVFVEDDGSSTPPVPVNGVSISSTSLNLNIGQSSDLTETVSPSNASNKLVSWSSSNTNIATVNANGLVRAQAVGSATIVVTTQDGGFTASSSVTVNGNTPGGSFSLGNNADTDATHDGWSSNMVVNETDTYTNTSGSPQQIQIDEFNFYAWRDADPVTPFVVRVNSDNNFTVLAVGTTRNSSAYNIGMNSFTFKNGSPSVITIGNGETIATGFLDANANGSGSGTGSVIPFDTGTPDQIWYSGGSNGASSGSISEGSAPISGAATLTNLFRNYHYNIQFSEGAIGGGDTPPNVNFITPTNGQTFAVGSNLTTEVNATDDGSISNVRLFLNGTLVRQENVAPYQWAASNQTDNSLRSMNAGTYTLRAVATDNNGNTGEKTIMVTVGSGPTGATLVIEAEDFNNTSGTVDDSVWGGPGLGVNRNANNINWVNNGDWAEYNINVSVAGTYAIEYNISTPSDGAQIQLTAGNTSATTNVPNNGSWDNYGPLSGGNIVLPTGSQTVRVTGSSSTTWQWNLDKITLVTGSGSRNTKLVEGSSSLYIYPNPATDQVTIKGLANHEYDVTLLSLQSIIVLEQKTSGNSATISLSGINPGLYLLKINGSGENHIQRLIIR